jgi:hypothetical protein
LNGFWYFLSSPYQDIKSFKSKYRLTSLSAVFFLRIRLSTNNEVYLNTGVPVSLLVPLPGPPSVYSLSVQVSISSTFFARLFVRIFCQSQNVTRKRCRNDVLMRNLYIKMLMKLTPDSLIHTLSMNKWVDLGIGSTDSGIPVYKKAKSWFDILDKYFRECNCS